jgi:LAO/AO transport system kinase
MRPSEAAEDAAAVIAADKTAVSRALNLVENRRESSQAQVASLLEALRPAPKAAAGHRVGLTGPPGVGKSSLAAALTREIRQRGRSVGVVAIDPSSIRSRGSLLGDRARMGFDPNDEGVFVRSLATGGEVGGLAYAANAAVRVLAAAYDVVIVETTGVGQSEVDVVHVVDTVVLVIQPGSGDVLQFLKAGIMEIPDILVVNKADQKELASRAVADLHGALRTAAAVGATAHSRQGWHTPIIATSAHDGTGIAELADALQDHRDQLKSTLNERRREAEAQWAVQLFTRRHGEHGVKSLGGRAELKRRVRESLSHEENPLSLSERLSQEYLNGLGNTQRGQS